MLLNVCFSEKSKRRTKTLANTNDPRWDQTFVYNGIRCTELRHRALEITVWDYGKYGTNNFLGEVVLGLGSSSLNNELEWHYLMAHEEHRQIGLVLFSWLIFNNDKEEMIQFCYCIIVFVPQVVSRGWWRNHCDVCRLSSESTIHNI